MLITISTPILSTEYKQLIEATYEQSTSTYVVFVGDGVYAPALNTAFFERLANMVKSTVKDKPTLNLSFLSTDADTRGTNLPEHFNPISHKELLQYQQKISTGYPFHDTRNL